MPDHEPEPTEPWLHIEEFPLGTPMRDPDAPMPQVGDVFLGEPLPRPLSFWRETLAKTGGAMPGPNGERFPVPLDRWADADPNTPLVISVRWIDPGRVGTTDPNPPDFGPDGEIRPRRAP